MRIASLQPSITITLKALNRLNTLCAITKYCLEALPELAARNLPVLHDSWTADTAEILAANPTLVLASVPYRMESLAAILKTGLPVLALAPHSLADIYADTRLIAALVDARGEAESLIEIMQQQIVAVQSQAANAAASIGRKPLVYCEEWGKPLIHSQRWVAELVEAAGGRFLDEPGSHTIQETIAAADPDVLLFAWCGAGDRVPLAKVIARRDWSSLKAVREGRVHCIPDEYLNTPAVTLLEGLACIAHAVHPRIFPRHPRVVTLVSASVPVD
jgi:iron complex transport system substrate-binding protein